MKAIRVHEFGGPEVMKLEEVADLVPGPGQVVVRVRAVGVNPVEAYVRTGTYAMKPTLPYTPGADAAGVVASVGEGVTSVKVGDRVYTSGSLSGTYAEQTLCTEAQVHPLPAKVSFEQGAAMGVAYGTAYRGLFQRGGAKPGETLLVHGASGGVGTAAVQLARAAGLLVIGTGRHRRRTETGEGTRGPPCGEPCDAGLSRGVDEADGRARVRLDPGDAGKQKPGNDLGLLAKKGRVVVIGNRGTIEINPRDAMSREADIRGMTLSAATEQELARDARCPGRGTGEWNVASGGWAEDSAGGSCTCA